MTAFTGRLCCPRCGSAVEPDAAFDGCPGCTADGVPVNVHPEYDPGIDASPDPQAPGLFRYHRLLPLPEGAVPISLHEGNTPLLHLRRLGDSIGHHALFLKDETRNPTWSYKDRLAAVAVTRAVSDGADTIVVGTTGNHGAAAAAYAAAAGVKCVAITLESVPLTMKVLMQVLGAHVVAVADPPERWAIMRRAVAERGWVPLSGLSDPPVGSSPFGIEGYKTIAYELVDDLGDAPDVVVVPVAYGDGLIGIHRGFDDLVKRRSIATAPRLVAVEPLGPYTAALHSDGVDPVLVEGKPSVAFSIASRVPTAQGVRALRESGGTAVVVSEDDEILSAQRRIAAAEGCYLEPSAAICLPAVERLLASGWIDAHESVVMIGTSSGLKDIAATAGRLPAVPLIEPTLEALEASLSGSPQQPDSGYRPT